MITADGHRPPPRRRLACALPALGSGKDAEEAAFLKVSGYAGISQVHGGGGMDKTPIGVAHAIRHFGIYATPGRCPKLV